MIRVAAGVAGLLLAFITLAIKTYNCVTLGICKSDKEMNGKTVIITGANSGKFNSFISLFLTCVYYLQFTELRLYYYYHTNGCFNFYLLLCCVHYNGIS